MCWLSRLLIWIYENYGIEKVEEAEKFAHIVEGKITFSPLGEIFLKESVEKHCDGLMDHEPIMVIEESGKIVVSAHPCGSGGYLIKKGLAVLNLLTWSISGLPIYCCYCPTTELQALEGGSDLHWIHPTGDPGKSVGPNCECWMYKTPADIPV